MVGAGFTSALALYHKFFINQIPARQGRSPDPVSIFT